MKHLKLFENFQDIDAICKEYGICNYIINSDGTIDVNGDVDLITRGLIKLPLKFSKVNGIFDCGNNKLTTLEGCPSYVGRSFGCNENNLSTLEYGPKEVGSGFYCHYNKLTTLEGCPKEVGGNFYCSHNRLKTLEGGPNSVGGAFYCNDNPIEVIYDLFGSFKEYQDSLDYGYLRGTDIVKLRFKEALEEIGKKVPDKIKGYNYI